MDQPYNPCAFSVNQVGTYHFTPVRKGILAQLFAMWFLFALTQIYLKIKCSTARDQELLPWNNRLLREQFMTIFGNNAIALSYTVLHNPFWSALAVSWLHMVVFLVYLLLWMRKFSRAAKVMYGCMQMINLWLMIIGMTGMRFETINSTSSQCTLS